MRERVLLRLSASREQPWVQTKRGNKLSVDIAAPQQLDPSSSSMKVDDEEGVDKRGSAHSLLVRPSTATAALHCMTRSNSSDSRTL